MSFPSNKASKRPEGIYLASSWTLSCDHCAYQGNANFCQLRKETIDDARKKKCRDWMDKSSGVEEAKP